MTRQDIIDAIEEGIDLLISDAPEYLSEAGRNSIKEEFTEYVRRVVESLSKDELASETAFERFMETTLAEARRQMRIGQRS